MCLKCESASRRFQPGEGPGRGPLRNCTTSLINRFTALVPREGQVYSLVAGDGALGGGVGGLEPLIAVTQPVERLNLRIADFEVEVALSISVRLQLVQG